MAQQHAAQDTIFVTTTTVACDGGKAEGGHPRVFLKLDPDTGEVTCPYCSATFKLDPHAKVAVGH